jgi:glycosyltransferase involved in cell wall biosynthesis
MFTSASGLRVLYAGSLIPRKSVSTLVEAAGLVRRQKMPMRLAVVGVGPELAGLREQCRQTDVEGAFVGERAPESIARWIAGCDVLVLPSRSEGRPLIVLEAMAMGRPVIATDIPGTRELVQHSVTGLLYPAGDAVALAAHLMTLGASRDERALMGERALAWFDESGLSASAMACRHVQMYEQVLAKHR